MPELIVPACLYNKNQKKMLELIVPACLYNKNQKKNAGTNSSGMFI
jgi:hypothetical protein